jgi:glycine/D-amino acid oxidase-like deaminating enzyme
MNSVWSESSNIESFKKLDGDCKCDVLIIGGGMAGVLCAYFLKEQGVDYLLVEGGKIGSGITKNTTAKITAQHGLIYSDLIKNTGEVKAKQYLYANLWAIKKYKELGQKIPCCFEGKAAFTYSLKDKKKIEDEVRALKKLGFSAEYFNAVPLPLDVKAAIKFNNQAQFNPLQFIAGIVKGLNIKENTFVKKVKASVAYTDNGNIKAKKIIITTHFPFINTHGFYFAKLYQSRSYVVAYKNAPNVDGMYVDAEQNGMSFRNYNDLLLIGGGDHRTGKIGGGYEELRNFAKTFYPDAEEKYSWATQDCMSLDSVPYIGRYSKGLPNVFVATGFNKWGMTSSMISAKILCDMILEKPCNEFDVFTPNRTAFKKQLFINLGETLTNFLSFSTKRCSHLGCSLKWNKLEHTWDCACHGSRFDENGKLIDNPAMKNTNVK